MKTRGRRPRFVREPVASCGRHLAEQPDEAEGIAVDRRLGIRIGLRVSGALRPSLAVEDAHVCHDGSPGFAQGDATVTYSLHNTGDAVLSGTPEVAVAGPFGTSRSRPRPTAGRSRGR